MSRRNRRNARARQEIAEKTHPNESVAIPQIDVREPSTKAEKRALFDLCMEHTKEAPARGDAESIAWRLEQAFNDDDDAPLVAWLGDEALGYLLLTTCKYWYSKERFIMDFGFYVLPKWRGMGVDKELLALAKAIAEAANLPVFISRLNPVKRGKAADLFGFLPMGCVLRFDRSEAPARMN